MYKKAIIALTITGLIFVSTACFIVIDGLWDNQAQSDEGVVLGSKIKADGTCSSRLAARLDKGIELYQKGLIRHLIVSGGGKKGFSEAPVMKNYLLHRHVPDSAIIMDNKGFNTAKSAVNTQSIMSQHQFISAPPIQK